MTHASAVHKRPLPAPHRRRRSFRALLAERRRSGAAGAVALPSENSD